MTAPTPSARVTCERPTTPWLAGDWMPLTLRVECPTSRSEPLCLRDIDVDRKLAPSLQLDTDLLQRNIEVRPGESYKVTVLVRMSHPGRFNLKAIYVDVFEIVSLPPEDVVVHPSLTAEVHLGLEAIVPYDHGTKVRLTLQHQGATPFRDFELRLGPENAVVAGKQVRRASFDPGDQEVCEAVVAPGELEVVLAATTDSGRAKVRRCERIDVIPTRTQRPPFRFLEPRRLASDDVKMYAVDERGAPPIVPQHAAFPLTGGGKYRIAIAPQNPQATRVRLRDAPGAVRIMREAASADGRTWTFEVEVTAPRVLSRLERIVYDVDEPGRPASGEVVVRLDPAWSDHFKFAITVGVALTAQGLFALTTALTDPNDSILELLRTFSLVRDVPIFVFPLAIPLAWLGVLLVNRIWCWLFV